MGNMMASLRNASAALKVFERGIGVVQSNVSNASTRGYAKQRQGLEAMRTDPDRGLPGRGRRQPVLRIVGGTAAALRLGHDQFTWSDLAGGAKAAQRSGFV